MKLLGYGFDGGKKSTVKGFWLFEIKSLFSIVFLKFHKGSRENFHSHAFNAVTFFIKGNVTEHHLDGRELNWRGSFKPKFTPRNCFHKIFAHENTYAISFRGPWNKTWQEYSPVTKEFITLKEGREVVEKVVQSD